MNGEQGAGSTAEVAEPGEGVTTEVEQTDVVEPGEATNTGNSEVPDPDETVVEGDPDTEVPDPDATEGTAPGGDGLDEEEETLES